MRQTGYYFVEYRSDKVIGYWDGTGWLLQGRMSYYKDRAIKVTHDTPITPEKMAAIDEIVRDWNINVNETKEEAFDRIEQTINKHKLI